MKQYYYLDGKNQLGPFEIHELKGKNLEGETLVWSEGMENWKKINDIPELCENVERIKTPPPIPNSILVSLDKKRKKNSIIYLISWCCFHLFAVILSYSGIDFWASYSRETTKFWPFIKFNACGAYDSNQAELSGKWMEYCFRGVFAEYDWSEFSIYILIGGITFIIFFIKTKK